MVTKQLSILNKDNFARDLSIIWHSGFACLPLCTFFSLFWATFVQFQIREGKNSTNEAGTLKQPHAMAQGSTDIEILGKGVRWRKYGQKVVKGNIYPR